MNRKLLIPTALAAATFIGVLGQTAHASLVIKLTSGTTTTTVTDNGPGDVNPAVGQIQFAGTVGAFSTVITSGISNSPGGANAVLQNQNISIRDDSNQRATLTISMSDTNFTSPTGSGLTLGSSFAGTFLSGTSGESATFQSYAGTDNTAFSTGVTSGMQSMMLTNGSLLPASESAADRTATFSASSPYSLSQVTTINLSANGEVNLAGTTSVIPGGGAVPEPASLSLLGIGVAFLAARRRRA